MKLIIKDLKKTFDEKEVLNLRKEKSMVFLEEMEQVKRHSLIV